MDGVWTTSIVLFNTVQCVCVCVCVCVGGVCVCWVCVCCVWCNCVVCFVAVCFFVYRERVVSGARLGGVGVGVHGRESTSAEDDSMVVSTYTHDLTGYVR